MTIRNCFWHSYFTILQQEAKSDELLNEIKVDVASLNEEDISKIDRPNDYVNE